MFVTVLAWMYISFICLTWGNMVIRCATSKADDTAQTPAAISPALVCLAGLSVIGTLSLVLSIFMPIALTAHLIMSMPVLLYYLWRPNRYQLLQQIQQLRTNIPLYGLLLFGGCALLILLISTYLINHPDTTLYHAQTIHLSEQFGVLPGTVYLYEPAAMSSSWFTAHAIFRFDFIWPNRCLFLNGCVLCWFCWFVYERLTERPGNPSSGIQGYRLLWLLLLVYTFVSFPQVRLTAASASPDFIVTLLIWAAFYLFARGLNEFNKVHALLVIVFSAGAFATKISATVILLLPLVVMIRYILQRKWRWAALLSVCCVAMVLPCLVRNVITSGYPFFPTTFFNFFDVDWKYSPENIHALQQYIRAYAFVPARLPSELGPLTMQHLWRPWWQNIHTIDRLLIGLPALLLIVTLVLLPVRKRYHKPSWLIAAILIALSGTVVWLLNAPAIRFGAGYLVSLTGLLLWWNGSMFTSGVSIPGYYLKGLTLMAAALLFVFSFYRFNRFFHSSQILFPDGLRKRDYTSVNYHGVMIQVTDHKDPCGFTPVPCVNKLNRQWVPRDTTVAAGFKGVK